MTGKDRSRSHLQNLEAHLHALIRSRVGDLVEARGIVLPHLTATLPTESQPAWFPVDGMYGGFSFWAAGDPDAPTIICESWSRVEDGSGQRHVITEVGSVLVDEGFV